MSFIQKMARAILPGRWSAVMEAESRSWVLRCDCGHETSVWDLGGIRYKAAGHPWRKAICGGCGEPVSGRLYRNPQAPASEDDQAPRPLQ